MIADLLPLMTSTVRHNLPTERDVFGKHQFPASTEHRARVLLSPGTRPSAASQSKISDVKATIWLIDHPRTIEIGHRFEITPNEPLEVIGFELRTIENTAITKVFLS